MQREQFLLSVLKWRAPRWLCANAVEELYSYKDDNKINLIFVSALFTLVVYMPSYYMMWPQPTLDVETIYYSYVIQV